MKITSGCNLNSIRFTGPQCQAIFNFLSEMGAIDQRTEVELLGNKKSGYSLVFKRRFNCPVLAEDEEAPLPTQSFDLLQFCRLLKRADSARYRKIKNVEGRVSKMFNAVSKLDKMIK